MTKITAGRWGGRRLLTPSGRTTRPTSERVRAALGNALQATGGLAGARVLDLYAGSGALGIELASRGADQVVLVEQDRAALTAARGNVEALAAGQVQVVAGDVGGFAARAGGLGPFDVVVADPPYELADADLAAVLLALVRAGALAPQADVVVERAARSGVFPWPEPLVGVRERRYGDTQLCYGRAP